MLFRSIVVVEMNPIAPALALVRRIDIGAIISRQALSDVTDLRIIPIENPTPMRIPGSRGHQPTAAAKSFAVILRNAVMETPMTAARTRSGNGGRRVPRLGASANRVTKLVPLAPK